MQSVWVTIGIVVFVVTLIVVRDVRVFERYRYIALLLGHRVHAAPARAGDRPVAGRRPALGRVRSAELRAERGRQGAARCVLCVVPLGEARAADRGPDPHRPLVRPLAARPRTAHASPGAWRSLVLAYEQDIGTSLLFFGVFAAMLYMTTRRDRVHRGHRHPPGHRCVRRVQGVRARTRARRELDQPVEASSGERTAADSGLVRARLGWNRGHRSRVSANRGRCRSRRPTTCSRRSARSSGSSGRSV